MKNFYPLFLLAIFLTVSACDAELDLQKEITDLVFWDDGSAEVY